MFIFALALLSSQSTPQTFEDLEIAKFDAFHNLKVYRWTMNASFSSSEDSYTTSMDVLRQGDCLHAKEELPENQVLEQVINGLTTWISLAPRDVYSELKSDSPPQYNPKARLAKCDPHSYAFEFETDGQMGFACDPPLAIQSIQTVTDNGDSLRKVVAAATSPHGHTFTVIQWFLPDSWILKRFRLDGDDSEGSFHAAGEATIDLNPKVPANAFVFDPKDFKKVDPSEMEGATGG